METSDPNLAIPEIKAETMKLIDQNLVTDARPGTSSSCMNNTLTPSEM